MDILPLFLQLWVIHSLVAIVLSAPLLILGPRRACWQAYELLALVLPFMIWAMLMGFNGEGKTLANLGECIYIALAIPVAVLLRIIIGQRIPVVVVSGVLLFALCGAAVAIYSLTPPLPE